MQLEEWSDAVRRKKWCSKKKEGMQLEERRDAIRRNKWSS